MKKLVPNDAVLIPKSAKCVFKGQIFDVYQWPQKMFDGSQETFEMLKRPDTVAVLAITDDKILVLDDEQPHVGTRKSFPSGRVDKTDINTLEAAKREILEETGYKFQNWRLVSVIQPHAKLEWFIYFYISYNGQKLSQPHLDAGERIRVQALPFSAVKSLVLDKAGYLGEALGIFEKVNSIQELTALPEFQGQQIDR